MLQPLGWLGCRDLLIFILLPPCISITPPFNKCGYTHAQLDDTCKPLVTIQLVLLLFTRIRLWYKQAASRWWHGEGVIPNMVAPGCPLYCAHIHARYEATKIMRCLYLGRHCAHYDTRHVSSSNSVFHMIGRWSSSGLNFNFLFLHGMITLDI